jgi:hypothetical protein
MVFHTWVSTASLFAAHETNLQNPSCACLYLVCELAVVRIVLPVKAIRHARDLLSNPHLHLDPPFFHSRIVPSGKKTGLILLM